MSGAAALTQDSFVASPRVAAGEAADWIVSPLVDVALFVGSAVTTLLPWLLVDRLHYPAFYALAAVAIISGVWWRPV